MSLRHALLGLLAGMPQTGYELSTDMGRLASASLVIAVTIVAGHSAEG